MTKWVRRSRKIVGHKAQALEILSRVHWNESLFRDLKENLEKIFLDLRLRCDFLLRICLSVEFILTVSLLAVYRGVYAVCVRIKQSFIFIILINYSWH